MGERRCRFAWVAAIGVALAGQAGAGGWSEAPGIAVVINGQPQDYAAPPMMVNGRAMVPMRGIFESLGAKVNWNGASHTVTAARAETGVRLAVGSRSAQIGGKPVLLAAAPLMYHGTVMVPLRFVSEALGAQVQWDPASRLISIGAPEGFVATAPQTPPAVLPASPAGPAQRVRVGLQEYTIAVSPNPVKAGAITFDVANRGITGHALAIEGTEMKTPLLGRGRVVTFTATLGPGVYTLYSPQGNDRKLGMETRLRVE